MAETLSADAVADAIAPGGIDSGRRRGGNQPVYRVHRDAIEQVS